MKRASIRSVTSRASLLLYPRACVPWIRDREVTRCSTGTCPRCSADREFMGEAAHPAFGSSGLSPYGRLGW